MCLELVVLAHSLNHHRPCWFSFRLPSESDNDYINNIPIPLIPMQMSDFMSPDQVPFVYTDDHSSYEGLINYYAINYSMKEWTLATILENLAHVNNGK